jgi:cytochrome d ubiquinol oxidase subunit II
MSLVDLVAALMFLGVVAYGIFGGADFGTGVWDLLAGDARHGGALRAQVDRSIGPVWEANHVWLIYVLVFLWTAFPRAIGPIMTTLWVPWLLAGLGIVLRGAGFAFRKFSSSMRWARLYGTVFAASSVLTPLFFGMIAGAIASGNVPVAGGDLWRSWTGLTSWVGGILAVLTCAFLAATFLAADAERFGDHELARYCGRRALVSGAITGVAALAAVPILEGDASTLADRLEGRAAPLAILSAIAGASALVLLWKGNWAWARVGAVVAVGCVLTGWGVAQYPDVLVDHLTLEDAAGARTTLTALVITFCIAAVTAVPALLWLFALVNRSNRSLQH